VGKVTASLDTSHYRGPVRKGVQVTTNDPTAGVVVLELRAEVTSVIDVAPTDSPVLRTPAGPRSAELTVSASDGKPFDILTVVADPSVKVTVRPAPDGKRGAPKRAKGGPVAAGSSRYLVTLTPTDAAPAVQSVANVTLTTSLEKARTVPIRGVLFPVRPSPVPPAPPAAR
jgi:hypothetical protein